MGHETPWKILENLKETDYLQPGVHDGDGVLDVVEAVQDLSLVGLQGLQGPSQSSVLILHWRL